MKLKLRLGTAGLPLACKGKTLAEGIGYTSSIGLNAFEVEFGRGVRGEKEEWKKARIAAQKNDILLSCHAPYWINCCSPIKEKRELSCRNLLETAKAAEILGAYIIVFHPGYFQKQTYESALGNCLRVLNEVEEKMKKQKLNCFLGAETTGKPSAFGSLQDNIKLSKEIKNLRPVIDFAHLHARTNGGIKTEQDYQEIFNSIESELGKEYLNPLHCHFTEIQYSIKGEIRHLPLGSNNSPDMNMLARVISNNKYNLTMISESPLIEKDALKMKGFIKKG
ncbi:MAG: TIM barrel protein [archaeon]